MHPRSNPIRVQTHDLQIMAVLTMLVLTTEHQRPQKEMSCHITLDVGGGHSQTYG